MSYSLVTGLQALNMSATVKHFLGYAQPEQGLNTGPVHGGERELRTTYATFPVRYFKLLRSDLTFHSQLDAGL